MSDYLPQGCFEVLWDAFNGQALEEIQVESNFLKSFGILESDLDEVNNPDTFANQATASSESISDSVSTEFQSLSSTDVVQFIENHENQSTAKKTLLDVRKFERFLAIKGEKRQFHVIESDQLDEYIANFVLSAKKMDGSDYEPCSLRNIISSLDRKLRRAKYPYSIFRETGHAFQLTRDALKAKRKSLKKMGKGNRPNCASPITDEEIDILYEKNILGDDNPAALLNTMWFNNTIHFGLRGVKENYNLRWGDVTLHKASNGTNYLELNERQTKTRTGEHISNKRIIRPNMFSTPSNAARDPVRLYQVYASKRPASYREPQDPFYIAPRTVPVSSLHDQWFMKSPVGENNFSVLMKNMAIQGELDLSKNSKITLPGSI